MKILLIGWMLLFSVSAQAQTPKRVITIGGALTEIIYALEAEALLVGNDTTSYFPLAADKLPKVGYLRALSAEGILSLNPDLLILTEEAGPPAVLEQLKSANISMLKLKASRSLKDIKASIQAIAKILKKDKAARKLINNINDESHKLSQAIAMQQTSSRVMFILQHGGGAPMVAGRGTSADSIIRLSGAENVVVDYEGYKPLTPEAMASLKPDVILITEQGLGQAGAKKAVLKSPGVALTPAAKKAM